jgi:quercetin dioxygenase-like cupin family protein
MNKFGKKWGFTSEIFTNNSVSVHRIKALKGNVCSKHCHQYKYNMFFVESGNIIVYRWENHNKIGTSLEPGQTITIAPNIYHQFEAIEDSIVYEIYYIKLEDTDIIRSFDDISKN